MSDYDLADRLVEREVICCLSSLLYDIGQHPEEATKVFDLEPDEVYDWFSCPDYDEAVTQTLNDLDFAELLDECDEVGYSSDALRDAGAPDGCEPDEWHESLEGDAAADADDVLRQHILDRMSYDDDKQEFCDRHNVDLHDYDREVYEHWAVTRWLGSKLEAHGERVFEFAGLTIWGRCCTGQSIALDYVIQEIARESNNPSEMV